MTDIDTSLILEKRKAYQKNDRAKPKKDLLGCRFGMLVVKGDPRRLKGVTHWHCACDCGGESFPTSFNLIRGNSRSCGCMSKKSSERHGLSKVYKREYSSWKSMRDRTCNENSKSFPSYGGAGVTCCERWADFKLFIDDMGRRPDGATLDRFHPDWKIGDPPLPYSPETCRWACKEQQENNRRNNTVIDIGGRSMTLSMWAREKNSTPNRILSRVRLGWSLSDAIMIPLGETPFKQGKRITIDGLSLNYTEWEKRKGLGRGLVHQRIKQGWSEIDAVMRPVVIKKGRQS